MMLFGEIYELCDTTLLHHESLASRAGIVIN